MPSEAVEPMPTQSPARRRRITLLFVALAAIWSTQFVFHELVSEPWPSLTFPRFGRVGGSYEDDPRHHSLQQVVIHDRDGSVTTITPDELFGRVGYDKGPIYGTQYDPSRGGGTDEGGQAAPAGAGLLKRIHAWPGDRLEDLLGDVPPFTNYYDARDRPPQGNSESSRAWLVGLLDQWRPGHSTERVEFIWHTYRGQTLGNDIDEADMVEDRYVVELD